VVKEQATPITNGVQANSSPSDVQDTIAGDSIEVEKGEENANAAGAANSEEEKATVHQQNEPQVQEVAQTADSKLNAEVKAEIEHKTGDEDVSKSEGEVNPPVQDVSQGQQSLPSVDVPQVGTNQESVQFTEVGIAAEPIEGESEKTSVTEVKEEEKPIESVGSEGHPYAVGVPEPAVQEEQPNNESHVVNVEDVVPVVRQEMAVQTDPPADAIVPLAKAEASEDLENVPLEDTSFEEIEVEEEVEVDDDEQMSQEGSQCGKTGKKKKKLRIIKKIKRLPGNVAYSVCFSAGALFGESVWRNI